MTQSFVGTPEQAPSAPMHGTRRFRRQQFEIEIASHCAHDCHSALRQQCRICRAGFEAREMGALSRQVHCKAFEIGERTVSQSSLMGRAQDDSRCLICLECFLPAGCA
jgi:hypothetical protein